jgi:hypothetical protein
MKTRTMYQIRSFKDGRVYSVAMTSKLRDASRASRLIKRLRKMGHDAFRSPVRVAVAS